MSEEPALSADERVTLLATAMLDAMPDEDAPLIGGTVKQVLRQLESAARIGAAAELVALSEQVLAAAVTAERASGASWSTVGKALGTSRSAAHGRFSETVAQRSVTTEGDEDDAAVRPLSTAELFDRLGELWAKIADKAAQERQLVAVQAASARSGGSGAAHQHQLLLSVPTGGGKTAAARRRVIEALTGASHGGYIDGPLVVSGPPGAGKAQLMTQAIEALRAEHPDSVGAQGGRRRILADMGRMLHELGETEEAERLADLAGRTEAGAERTQLRLQHERAVRGESPQDAEAVGDLDVSPNVLVTGLPSARELTQQVGRVNRTEQRLTRLEAQFQMILDRLPEPPGAEHDPEPVGHRP